MAELKDSGNRQTFQGGAVRDISEGKGRCDLLPLNIVDKLFKYRFKDWEIILKEWAEDDLKCPRPTVLKLIDLYIQTGNIYCLYGAICAFIDEAYSGDIYLAVLELSIHYEDGARKYDERNWEKGILIHCFIDSGIRHYLKWLRVQKDDPHDRAFIWNIIGILWTLENKPEFDDIHVTTSNSSNFLDKSFHIPNK